MNPGDQLDHYRIEGVVSRDNIATIFRATDVNTNETVAIKMPHPGMETDPAFVDRFHREQEIGRTLNHPGVLKVLANDHRSKDYLVEEWFNGQPLRQILAAQKKLEQARAVRIALAVCEALEYVHGHGIVHRDLRPENILVDAADHVKLTDFRVAAKEGAPRLTFTNLAQLVGASAYISPEELKGNRGDARSDIYSLGVILYEMLTGKTPFPGAGPYERLAKNPVPPRELEPSIPPQLQEVIYRAIEREHKNRYPTAHEFAADLGNLNRVGVTERTELKDWKKGQQAGSKKTLVYALIALIPIILFGLLLYFSRH
jgi:serine/threonine-protein kinase